MCFVSTGVRSVGGGSEFVTVVNEGEARYFFRQFVKTTATARGGETSVARSRAFRSLGHVRPLSRSEKRGKRKEREREGKREKNREGETKESLEAGGSLSTQPRRHVGTPAARRYVHYVYAGCVLRRNAHRRHVIQARIRIPRYLAGVGKRLRRILPIVRLRTCVLALFHGAQRGAGGSHRKSGRSGRRESNGGKINEAGNFHDSWTTHRRKNTDISSSLSVKSPETLTRVS